MSPEPVPSNADKPLPSVPPGSMPTTGWRAVPTGVWALGFVSMLMDISSEMIHALLPLYMVAVLGTSALSLSLIHISEPTRPY